MPIGTRTTISVSIAPKMTKPMPLPLTRARPLPALPSPHGAGRSLEYLRAARCGSLGNHALATARRADKEAFALRAPVFALGTARRADKEAFEMRAPVFALGTARRAHGADPAFAAVRTCNRHM